MRLFLIVFFLIIFSDRCFSSDIPVIVFQDSVCIKPHHGYHYQTCHSITVTIDHFIVEIPTDFDTDLASIPRWLWEFIAPSRSDFIPASVLHDYLYTCNNGYKREEIDEIFYQSLISSGVSKMNAYEMYIAVRLFGNNHFNKDQRCSIRLAKMVKKYGSCHEQYIDI